MTPETKEQLKRLWRYKLGVVKLVIIVGLLALAAYFFVTGYTEYLGLKYYDEYLGSIHYQNNTTTFDNPEFTSELEWTAAATYGMTVGLFILLRWTWGVIALIVAGFLWYVWIHD